MKNILILLIGITTVSFDADNIFSSTAGTNSRSQIILFDQQILDIFSAAKKVLPLATESHYRIGVLERGRTDTSCFVSYSNESIHEMYEFLCLNGSWRKGSLLEKNNGTQGILGKIMVYNAKIAEIWIKAYADPVPAYDGYANDHYETGDYVETWTEHGSDEDSKYNKAKFYPGTESNNNKVWTASFTSWQWSRVTPPVFTGSSTTQTTVNTTYTEYGINYGCEHIILSYHLQVDDAPDIVLENQSVSTTKVYTASNSITAGPNFTVESTGDVIFQAGNFITLLPGFHAVSVSKFHAYIDEGLGKIITTTPDVKEIEEHLPGDENDDSLPAIYSLSHAYPNPFNPVTTIRFGLPEAARTRLVVYNLLGREVVRLVDGHLEPGYYAMRWNGRTAAGIAVPSGIYIAHIVTPEYTKSIKMLLLK